MNAWILEIRRMAEMLENELTGTPINRHEAQDLAHRLARQFPHIEGSLAQIITRLARDPQMRAL